MSETHGRPTAGRARDASRARPLANGVTTGAGAMAATLAALEGRLSVLERELATAEPPPPGGPAEPPRGHVARPGPPPGGEHRPPPGGEDGSPVGEQRPPEGAEADLAPPGWAALPGPAASEDVTALVAHAQGEMTALRSQLDELLRFRDRLRSSAEELLSDYRRALDGRGTPGPGSTAGLPARGSWQEGVVLLDVGPFLDIATLGSFERALRTIDEADDVHVRSYLDGRAQLELALRGPTPLIERIRTSVAIELAVRRASAHHMEIELGVPPRPRVASSAGAP